MCVYEIRNIVFNSGRCSLSVLVNFSVTQIYLFISKHTFVFEENITDRKDFEGSRK